MRNDWGSWNFSACMLIIYSSDSNIFKLRSFSLGLCEEFYFPTLSVSLSQVNILSKFLSLIDKP